MPINFPDTPTLNQEFNSGNITFVWNGTSWDAKRILDGASAYEVAVNNGFIGTEQEWLDSLIAVVSASLPLSYNSGTKDIAIDLSEYDTSSEVTSKISTAISNLVDSAPSSLDTLNELAAALDDDANFATTVTNQIATKVSFSGSETLLNKRINPRTETSISPGILTINSDTIDFYTITNLAQNLSFAAPSGTPVEGQRLTIRIKDNGTARTISWNSIFRGSADLSLPTITVASTTMYLGFIYNSEDLKWDMIARLGNF